MIAEPASITSPANTHGNLAGKEAAVRLLAEIFQKSVNKRQEENDQDDKSIVYKAAMDQQSRNDVMKTLKDYPYLASRVFPCADQTLLWYPFTYLLVTRFPLEVLRKVHKMSPAASESDYLDTCLRCRKDDTELIQFILDEFPITEGPFSSQYARKLYRALKYAIEKDAPAKTVQILLKKTPKWTIHQDMPGLFEMASAWATQHDDAETIVDEVIDIIAKSDDFARFHVGSRHRSFKKNQLLFVRKLVPHLTQLYVDAASFVEDTEGLRYLFSYAFAQNQSLKSLSVNSTDWFPDTNHISIGLEKFLQDNRNIGVLKLMHGGESPTEGSRFSPNWLTGIGKGLQQNTTLKYLHLQGFSTSDMTDFIGILAAPNLTTLFLEYTTVADKDEKWRLLLPQQIPSEKSKLKQISFVGHNIPPDCLYGILECIAGMPRLESLRVKPNQSSGCTNGMDYTLPIMSLLTGIAPLKELETENMQISMEVIFGVLNQKEFLKTLTCRGIATRSDEIDIIADERAVISLLEINTCLTSVAITPRYNYCNFSDKGKREFDHLIGLNANERGQITAATPLPSLVTMLYPVDKAFNWNKEHLQAKKWKTSDPLNLFNLHYCFLRKCPKVWSGNSDDAVMMERPQRKKPRLSIQTQLPLNTFSTMTRNHC